MGAEGHETRLIEDDASFAAVLGELASAAVYAVDTEFHRERTYYPRVALVQIGWEREVVLVDPLKVDLQALAPILDGAGLLVMHAAGQDLEVLQRACQTVPGQLFDTQIAAGFIGLRSPSLAAVLDRLLGVRLPKGDRLTDWLERPLTLGQLDYAAADVAHLIELHRRLVADLSRRGRLQWAEDECEELRVKSRVQRDPTAAWLRIKEVRHLNKRGRGVAQAVAEWRERRAMELDIPPRFVLSDLAIVGISQRVPTTPESLRKVRGVDDRHARGDAAQELLGVIVRGMAQEVELPRPTPGHSLEEDLRPAVTLVSSWLAQFSTDLALDPALLGTRADIEAFLRGDQDARLAHGWRRALAGEAITRLVGGEAALAFEHGRLVLEDRRSSSLA